MLTEQCLLDRTLPLISSVKPSFNSLASLEGHIISWDAAHEVFRNIQQVLNAHFEFNVPYVELVILSSIFPPHRIRLYF